jgi:endonuclease YncB( thermonuclease family)
LAWFARLLLACSLLLSSLALLPGAASAQSLLGKVVGVIDGDTVRLLANGRDLYILRLGEIDAPESGQPYGRASKKMLSDLVFGQTISARVTDVDRYGRSVAVITRGSTNINAEIVKRGGAWAYRRYLSDQGYILWEREAKAARRGLWGLQPDQIMAPWDWRAARRGRGGGNNTRASVAPQGALPPTAMQACGIKVKCSQMSSCEEARYHLRECGLTRLDDDGDGVPCEKICR